MTIPPELLIFAGVALLCSLLGFAFQGGRRREDHSTSVPAAEPVAVAAELERRTKPVSVAPGPVVLEMSGPLVPLADDAQAARPTVRPVRGAAEGLDSVPRLTDEEDDNEDDITKVQSAALEGPRDVLRPPAIPILMDPDADGDEPTGQRPLILLSAKGQTHVGKRRKANEDSLLILEEHSLFVVADGMGGYNGGEIASQLAVETMSNALRNSLVPADHDDLPKAASELANAMQLANSAILTRAEANSELTGMGTTLSAALFSPRKQRVYIGHVGDSRVYRWRNGEFRQMTADHTMADFGLTGSAALQLSRAIGVWPTVPIDVLIGKPLPDDMYLMCSDGLTKMVPDDEIAGVVRELATSEAPGAEQVQSAVDDLIERANKRGGRDNVSVILVRVADAAPEAA